jgi:hypothetical protein
MRPSGYRTRRPGWLTPAIHLPDDPERCRYLACRPFDLLAPDYDVVHDGRPESPLCLSVCDFGGWCRYRAVLYPQPWQNVTPQATCAGYDPIWSGGPGVHVVDVAPETRLWWPEAPPSSPRTTPASDDELITFAGRLVFGPELARLATTNPRQAHAEARGRCKEWRGNRGDLTTPNITIKQQTVRLSRPNPWGTGRPPLELEVDAFIAYCLPLPRQLELF